MRWEHLFADMESQMAATEVQDWSQEVADLTRAERAGVALADRLRGVQSAPGSARVTLALRGGELVGGAVTDVGPSWLLVTDGGREHLVPLAAVVRVSGLPHSVVSPAGPALRRLGLGHALRAVARDRSVVRLVAGAAAVHGRIDAVGADHVDVTAAYPDSGRPSGDRHTLPFTGLEVVTSL